MELSTGVTIALFVIGQIIGIAAAWAAMHVKLALTTRRAQEAFEIAKAARDKLAAFELEAAKGFASIAHMEKTEAKLMNEISGVKDEVSKVVAAIDKLRDFMMDFPKARPRGRET